MTKFLRAIQNAQIQGANGLQYVRGPEVSFDDKVLADGEVIEVADSFVVNPEVFEVVRPTGRLDQQNRMTYVPVETETPKKKTAGATA